MKPLEEQKLRIVNLIANKKAIGQMKPETWWMVQHDEPCITPDQALQLINEARIEELEKIRDKWGRFRDETLGYPVNTDAVSVKDINKRMDELRLASLSKKELK